VPRAAAAGLRELPKNFQREWRIRFLMWKICYHTM